MIILLTNDDGVHADGLQSIRRELEKDPEVELYVVAPESERSAASHAITLHKPLYVNQISVDGSQVPMWSTNGTPADCTKAGVLALVGKTPHLVISGINRGSNLGTDVLYSGTVSAAFEGAILGVPSIAVSLAGIEDLDYSFAARFTARLARMVLARGLPPETLLNVNIPALNEEHIAGVRITRLGVARYRDVFHKRTDPRGRTYYWLAGELDDNGNEPGTDLHAIRNNEISITPLRLNLTFDTFLPELESWLPELG